MKSRCKTGCLTCRRRRKKCDESSYPSCKNCLSNGLSCTWPETVLEAKNKIVLIAEDKLDHQLSNPTVLVSKPSPNDVLFDLTSEKTPYQESDSYLRQENISEYDENSNICISPKVLKTSNYFLQRIAMQQDCVDDESPVELVPVSEKKVEIRSRIWNQLDVLVDADQVSSINFPAKAMNGHKSPSPLNT